MVRTTAACRLPESASDAAAATAGEVVGNVVVVVEVVEVVEVVALAVALKADQRVVDSVTCISHVQCRNLKYDSALHFATHLFMH